MDAILIRSVWEDKLAFLFDKLKEVGNTFDGDINISEFIVSKVVWLPETISNNGIIRVCLLECREEERSKESIKTTRSEEEYEQLG